MLQGKVESALGRGAGKFTLKSRPDVLSICHCLVTDFREGRAQQYLSLALHQRSPGHGSIQGAEGTGVSVGR